MDIYIYIYKIKICIFQIIAITKIIIIIIMLLLYYTYVIIIVLKLHFKKSYKGILFETCGFMFTRPFSPLHSLIIYYLFYSFSHSLSYCYPFIPYISSLTISYPIVVYQSIQIMFNSKCHIPSFPLDFFSINLFSFQVRTNNFLA